jgi:hypothetical protein
MTIHRKNNKKSNEQNWSSYMTQVTLKKEFIAKLYRRKNRGTRQNPLLRMLFRTDGPNILEEQERRNNEEGT